MSVDEIRADLAAEHDALDRVVAGLDAEAWSRATPAAGWDVADQIAHLTYFDAAARTAILDDEGFAVLVASLAEHLADIDGFTLSSYRALAPDDLLAAWRSNRVALDEAAATLAEGRRVAWFGPSMGATSFLTARLMETWAHGVDVSDALRAPLSATARLRHVAHLGYVTRRWSYLVRGEEAPAGTVGLALTAPDGTTWSWGVAGADDVVRGPALDFCLVVTQRRHVADTALVAGDLGRHWLERAQAFAGGATSGPAPGGHHVAR